MATPSSLRESRIWQNAIQLTVDIFQLAGTLPPAERTGLGASLTASATRIPTLVAAGHKTGSRSGMVTHCRQALDAATELETLLTVLGQLYPNVPSNDLLDQLEDIQQTLAALVTRLSDNPKPQKPGPRKTI